MPCSATLRPSAARRVLVAGAAEFALAAFGAILGRAIGYFDALLADRFTRHVSIRVMEHASRLDLASYEDPVFYDKLERARVQATDRIAMIQAMGTVLQQIIAAVSLSAGILWFSPWLLLLLVVAVVPAFLGESHFAFVGYSLNIRQTPVRRQLDYLRTLGASKESAKELKLFGLSGFLIGEYAQPVQPTLRPERAIWRAAACGLGAFLSLLSTGGYYGAYAYVIYKTVTGDPELGHRCSSWRARIAGASTNIQNIFSTFSSIADQSLFLTDLVDSCASSRRSDPSPTPCLRRVRFVKAFVFEKRFVRLSRSRRAWCSTVSTCGSSRRADRSDRRERPGQNHHRQADHAALRSDRRPHPARRRRPARLQHRGSALARSASSFRTSCATK